VLLKRGQKGDEERLGLDVEVDSGVLVACLNLVVPGAG